MSNAETVRLPRPSDVVEARARIAGWIRPTPLLESAWLNSELRGRVLFKVESLQLTGSFKPRGAFNRVLVMSAEERRCGIVAWSAGNHAQALALAGYRLGIPVTIVMPADAPDVKADNTRRWGAQIVVYDPLEDDREAIGLQHARESGAVVVPPYDDPWVIAGQGTVGLEALEDAQVLDATPDRLVAPVGGGGLVAGCALAAAAANVDIAVLGAEPAGHDSLRKSLLTGQVVENDSGTPSIADALMVNKTGRMTFQINRQRLAGGIAVSEAQLVAAVKFAFTELRVVLEAGGAAALAAVLAAPEDFAGRTTIVVLSGGNIDPQQFTSILGRVS
jgi:threonine dehydratase